VKKKKKSEEEKKKNDAPNTRVAEPGRRVWRGKYGCLGEKEENDRVSR
jgi:hypothetical protein